MAFRDLQSGKPIWEKQASTEPRNSKELSTGPAGSPGRTRTYDQAVNSRPLYQLSYRGIEPCNYMAPTRPEPGLTVSEWIPGGRGWDGL